MGVGGPGDLRVNFRLEEEKPVGEQRLSGHSYLTWEANSQGCAIQSEKEIKGILIEQEEVTLTLLTQFTLFLNNLVWGGLITLCDKMT